MAEKRKESRKRFERVVFLKMPNDMYDILREFAERKGLTVSAAIRLMVAEALLQEETARKRQPIERRVKGNDGMG
jgi:hypothetical protein